MSSYLEPYRRAVERLGPRFEALLWNSPATQAARFAAMADSIELHGRVIADLGCGRADLLSWLHTEGIQYGRYIGVDAIDELLDASRTRAADEVLPEAVFVHADFVSEPDLFKRLTVEEQADVLLFSGSLNTLEEDRALEVLGRAWEALSSVQGGVLAFNFLSSCRETLEGPAKRFDVHRVFRWALERTALVVFRQDYLGDHDATVVMRA